jgi:transposase
MNRRYHVDLDEAEYSELNALVSSGKRSARKIKRAQILLAAHGGLSDEAIATGIAVGGSTVYRTKRRFVEAGLEAALSEEPRAGAERKLTDKQQALLIATACSSPPPGRARWTLELLAGEMVRLTEHDSLSRETVRRRLIESDLKPWRKKMWCIPKVDAEYVARMEDVLDLYGEEPDPKRPVVCFDETPIQLIGEVRQPIPAEPGRLERFDYEYRRNGTANLFIFLDAHRPWRNVKVTDQRKADDFALCMRELSDTTSLTPSASASSSTISQPTSPLPSMEPSHPSRPDGCCSASNSTTPRSTPAGSTRSRSRSAFSSASASIAASTTERNSSSRSQTGNANAISAANT